VSDELRIDALREAFRPLLAELVAEEVERRLAERVPAEEEPPYLTVAEYAKRRHSTPAAIRARIRRGKLAAEVPPGGREYLIPNEQAGGHGG
jgi:hypothetical protein